MNDLAIVIVSYLDAHWLRPCLTTVLEHRGDADVDVVVATNGPTTEAEEIVEREFPDVRVLTCENRGFAHANNRALMTCDARYVLFLNPDTEIREGTFAGLVDALDERPTVGLVGVRQVTPDGRVYPTMRRAPNALRAFGEAIGAERLGLRSGLVCERILDMELYDRETACDWTAGSFMMARREALEGAGFMDERFFLFSEEKDLCLRIKQGGWEIRHLPRMTILHHALKAGIDPRLEAQNAYSKVQFARKHFSPTHRALFISALYAKQLLRLAGGAANGEVDARRTAARRALRTLMRTEQPPFGDPPPTSVESRDAAARSER